MHKLYFTIVTGLLLTFPALAQTLTISSAGNSGSYSYSAGTVTLSGNATITAAQIVSWLGSSSLTILGGTNAISVDVNQDINSTAAGNGLTIGNANSTGTVTFNNTVSLMGTLTVYANNIRMGSTVVANSESAQLIAGGSSGSISLLAKNGFETLANSGSTRGKIMTTGGGNIHINADTDADNSGQLNIDWLTLDGGAGEITLEGSSYNWNTGSGVSLPEFYGSGTLTIRNVTGANYSFNTAWISIISTFSGLTLGSNTGVEEITLAECSVCSSGAENYTGSTLDVAGPINLYGSKITVALSLRSTLANADILLKAKNSIEVNPSRSITSNNGDITFWANADGTANATDGDFIGLQNAVVINSANGSTIQATGGGTITMAGGTTTQTLASGTIVPTGYAYSNRTTFWGPLLPPGGVNFGYSTAANGQQNSLSIYSGGGDVVIKGKSHSSSAGIQWFSGMTGATQIINSGNGTILFDGLATSTNAHGIELNSYASNVAPSITSSSSSSTAIRFVGETAATADRAGFQGAATIIANATGGGIEISGKTPSASTYGAIEAGGIQTYALTGPITFIGEGSGGLKIGGTWGTGSLASSSSNIVLRSNVFTLNNPTIQTTGTITVEPLGTSFTNAISYPITNLSIPNTISGLTIGKDQNTANITFASNTSVAGPIAAYGGVISVNANLTTTTQGAAITLKASDRIALSIGASNAYRSIQTVNGNIVLWSNAYGSTAGGIRINDWTTLNTANGATNQTTGGGKVWLAGGTAVNASGLPTGPAIGTGNSISGVGFGDYSQGSTITSIYSGGGDIYICGEGANSAGFGGGLGVSWNRTGICYAGNGTIQIIGEAKTSAGAHGVEVGCYGGAGGTLDMRAGGGDANTPAIYIKGTTARDIYSGVLTSGGSFQATGSGGIYIEANGLTANTAEHIAIINMDVLAASGNISLIANGPTSGLKGLRCAGTIGRKDNTQVTTSSSNVLLSANNVAVNSALAVATTGTLTIEPYVTSFINAFSWPISSFTTTGITGLTLGKLNNTAGITFTSNTSIAGPITVYGGTLALNANLTTTSANSSASNISLNGSTISGTPTLTLATGSTLTMNLSSNTNFGGTISGTTLSFVKNGAGLLTLATPTTPTAYSFTDLTISGGTFQLNANQQLTLSNLLTNNGTFTIKDGATFVQSTSVNGITGNGTFNVEKALAGNSSTWNSTTSGRFWYMGVPMNVVARSSFGNYNASSNRLWSYSEMNKVYTDITSDLTTLVAGTGYVHRRASDETLSFSANGANGLFSSDLSLNNLSRTSGSSVGFHLIANPYMAYLDWHAVTKSNVEQTYYIRSNNAGSDISALITYNGSNQQLTHNTSLTLTSAQMQYIAPMQAIWVRVGPNTGTGSLSMTRSMLSHQTGNPGLKNTSVFPTLARVNLVDGARFDQLLVLMNEYMTNAVDQNDSEKMFVSGAPQIYTMASGKKLVMNGLKNNKKKISVPLYLELPTSKVYQLQLSEYIMEDGLILLEDKQEGTMQDFTIHDTYAFYANSGVLSNRFVLHFYMPDATITAQGPSNSWVEDESAINEGGSILVSSNGRGKVTIQQDIDITATEKGSVVVRDAAGREVYNGQISGSATILELNSPSGVYFVEVQLNGQLEMKKIFVQQ